MPIRFGFGTKGDILIEDNDDLIKGNILSEHEREYMLKGSE